MAAEEPYDIRVKTYFPKVADFERDERGDPIFHTRKGPERIEARQQLARERLVAGAEVKLLHDKLKWCYFKEGVNHLENCKDIVKALSEKIQAPYYGMPGAPSREW